MQVFNSSEMRIKGTELEKFARNKSKGVNRGKNRPQATRRGFDDTPVGGSGMTSGKTSKWRQQSSLFREAIRQVKYALYLDISDPCSQTQPKLGKPYSWPTYRPRRILFPA